MPTFRAKTPSVEQVSPQQQYQQPPQNMRMAPMAQPGLPVAAPLPGLSGQANSVVGKWESRKFIGQTAEDTIS